MASSHPSARGSAGATPRLVALALLVAIGCGGSPPAPARPLNLLVVLVDTLRADRLSLYGYARETSPSLDRFARERGVVFDNAWANAGCTFPSVNSLLTGRWPQRFLERFAVDGLGIGARYPTLGERLRATGYATAAVSASQIVRATPSRVNARGGFERGFERFDESCLELDARCVNGRAVAELDRLSEPFFLYLHYLDPHQPYRPPPEFPRRWADATAGAAKGWARRGSVWRIQQRIFENARRFRFGAAEVRHLSDLYDEEIRHVDDRFAELVAELDRRRLLERTVVVFVADHGEELYENGGFGHCRGAAWETLLATPIVFAVPGLEPGRRTLPVSNIDLMPTLLDLAGVPDPEAGLDGRSLRRLLERAPEPGASRRVFATLGPWRAARDAGLKLRFDLISKRVEFLVPSVPDRPPAELSSDSGALAGALDRWLREAEGGSAEQSVRQGEALEAELRALGYL